MKNNKNITLLWLLIFMSSTQWVSAQMFGGRPIMKKPSVTVNCGASGTGFVGNFVAGSVINGSSFIVILTNNSSDQIVINFAAADLQITGVTGLTVGTPTGSPALNGSGNATINGGSSVTVTYPLTGTLPNTCGNFTGTWTKLTPVTLSCQKVQSITPTNFLKAVTGITFSGNNTTGFTVNWNAITGATGFTLEHSTSQTGPWTAFPSNPYTGTSASITGLSIGKILFYRITVIGGTCDGTSIVRPVNCFAPTSNGGFILFKCHNLGADTTADPFTPSWKINGAYFNWGANPVDTNGDTYKTKPNTLSEGFLRAPTGPTDINQMQAGGGSGFPANNHPPDRWTVSGGINDPCPNGYRVPTRDEWTAITFSLSNWQTLGTSTGDNDPLNFTSGMSINNLTLFLPFAGNTRIDNFNNVFGRGARGNYWCSTYNDFQDHAICLSMRFDFVDPNTGLNANNGLSIRCVVE